MHVDMSSRAVSGNAVRTAAVTVRSKTASDDDGGVAGVLAAPPTSIEGSGGCFAALEFWKFEF